ncbi:hypothetical protein GX865_00390 [Candidatus Saccharibacteria bacterium]|jgi:hypothetical protein|nr:hypothetical protein [Candidatus Saccharibacteria bacterium]
MQQFSFWKKQTKDKLLFADIEWNKPEQKSFAGKLGIIGGNKLSFAGVAESYSTALSTGAGEVKVLLPEALKRSIPPAITEAQFAPNNVSGSLSRKALPDMKALGQWSDGVLLIGDAGRSSETAILYDDFIRDYEKWITLTRDSIDLMQASHPELLERGRTLFVASFAQTQKLFRSVYYPKVLTFNMQLAQFVDAIHKFTVTYPVAIATLHKDNLVISFGGEVVSMEWGNPLAIWRGITATQMASYLLWNEAKPLEAIATSVFSKK